MFTTKNGCKDHFDLLEQPKYTSVHPDPVADSLTVRLDKASRD